MPEALLLVATMVAATLLLLVVARYVIAITKLVNHFGAAKDSQLAQIHAGLKSIDRDTSIIGGGATELNAHLEAIRVGLIAVDKSLVKVVTSQV